MMMPYFHPTRIILLTFSLLLHINSSAAQDPVYREYYPNGRLKQVTHQGNYQGCGVPVGTDSLFDPNGQLVKTISYLHEGKANAGCHDLVTRQTITTYHQNGRRKMLSYFTACYECTPVPYGLWKWFDDKGRLVKSEKKKNVF